MRSGVASRMKTSRDRLIISRDSLIEAGMSRGDRAGLRKGLALYKTPNRHSLRTLLAEGVSLDGRRW